MKSLLSSNPALWFLFVLNLTIALAFGFEPVADSLGLDGTQQVLASVFMGLIGLGAGANLLRRRLQTR
ncbi:hypothetical protein [Nocardia sp. XZ_19_231]|uniref:hypothetical protein n=1 Tax=Nocardia sp. XZ_19_231 TaxID=2769252 RepID=UPI00188EA3B0|nr:hypothetical protein [Nocardia sp. XZ_19_231]